MEINELHALFLECSSASTDTRKITKNAMFFALKGDNFNGNVYAKQALQQGAKYAIIDDASYVRSSQTILVKDVLTTLQQLASFHRLYLKTPIIALTGSNGKTTTKELINATLSKKYQTVATKGNLNNHIGVPLTLLLMDKFTEIGIVEMGANHQKEIEFLCSIAKPDYGLITNFGKAHLEGFGGIEGVIKGKSEIYEFLITNNKTIFVNSNDPIQVEKTKQANIFTFGKEANVDVQIGFIEAQPNVKVQYNHLIINTQLIGEYNFTNIAIAIAIANYFKVDDNFIKEAIEAYIPSNNRSQVIQTGTHKIIMDAYNANPTSMRAALLNFEKLNDKIKVAILGDMFELGHEAEKEHQNIVDLASTQLLDKIILIGANFYKTKIVSPKVTTFESFDDFKNNFNLSELEFATLLIKGSRGMALERVLELL
ncbi:UDP-N-acetylmuramoyl-tripeptide--D-alanyl-D-alanine ligase [Gaetbulibacter aquiaggeris]|uniref:UDP-N-acetylmuramoyl-tripeptide--D-alanyl-D-alanine ligase n=1 Tax=Gaetbulibacter aquiaggeris TaxID=1735373 RepID=A0ABW7MTN3_9FLAO